MSLHFFKRKRPTTTEFDNYIENYRDNLTQHCQATGESTEFFNVLKANKLLEWLKKYKITKPKSIFDFGCGDGMMTSEVKKLFPTSKVYGADPSPESIAIATKNHPNISFSVSSEIISHSNSSFDVVYAAGVFHHIPFDMHTHYIQECLRVLKPKGFLILFELNPLNPGTQYIFHKNPIDQNATMLTPWYAEQLVKNDGYKETVFYCFFPHALRVLRPLENYLTRVPLAGLYGIIVQKDA